MANDLLILVRLGAEVTIKSPRTRSAFMKRLTRNMRDALNSAGIPHRVEAVWGRVFVRAASQMALPVLARVFGVSSVSFVEREVAADLDTIVQNGAEVFRDAVAGRRFAVRARRAGHHPFASKDIEKQRSEER